MAFPLDPNAPGGPRRSEYVRRSLAEAGAEAQSEDGEVTVRLVAPEEHEPMVVAEVDGQPVAALGVRDGTIVAKRGYTTGGIVSLMHLRRLEARIIMSVFGA